MPAFVARYAQAFADVVEDLKLDPDALDHQFADFLATWEGSLEVAKRKSKVVYFGNGQFWCPSLLSIHRYHPH